MEIYTYSKADLMLSSKLLESAAFCWFSMNDKQRYDKEMFLTLTVNLPHSWVQKIPRESMLAIPDKDGSLWEPQILTIDVLKMLGRADKFFKKLWSKDYKELDSFDSIGRFIITNVFRSYCAIKIVMPITDQVINKLLEYIALAIIHNDEDNFSIGHILAHSFDTRRGYRSKLMSNLLDDLVKTAHSWTTPFTAADMRFHPFHTVLRTASDLWPKFRLNGQMCTDKLPPNYYVLPKRSSTTWALSGMSYNRRLALFSEVYSFKSYQDKIGDEWPIYNGKHPLFNYNEFDTFNDDEEEDDDWVCNYDDCCD